MSQYIITQQTSNSDGEIVIKYFFWEKKTNKAQRFRNWFSVNDKKIEFGDKIVVWALILKNKYILVNLDFADNRFLGCNLSLYNLKGDFLWTIESPRSKDGMPIDDRYVFDDNKNYQFKDGNLIVYISEKINRKKKQKDGDKIYYEIDLKTGKILNIYEKDPYIFAQTVTTAAGEYIVEYYHNSGANKKQWQNWFSINQKKNQFKNIDVHYVEILNDKFVLVIVGRTWVAKYIKKPPQPPIDRNVYCYDLQGNLLWEIEQPRLTDGKPIEHGYMFHESFPQYKISKNGHLIVYVPDCINMGEWENAGHSCSRNDIHYEISLKTGKIVAIHEGILRKNLI